MLVFQLVLIAIDSEGDLVDSRVTQLIRESIFEDLVREAAIEGPMGVYQVATELAMPLYRLDRSFHIMVEGRVRESKDQAFITALEKVWADSSTVETSGQ